MKQIKHIHINRRIFLVVVTLVCLIISSFDSSYPAGEWAKHLLNGDIDAAKSPILNDPQDVTTWMHTLPDKKVYSYDFPHYGESLNGNAIILVRLTFVDRTTTCIRVMNEGRGVRLVDVHFTDCSEYQIAQKMIHEGHKDVFEPLRVPS